MAKREKDQEDKIVTFTIKKGDYIYGEWRITKSDSEVLSRFLSDHPFDLRDFNIPHYSDVLNLLHDLKYLPETFDHIGQGEKKSTGLRNLTPQDMNDLRITMEQAAKEIGMSSKGLRPFSAVTNKTMKQLNEMSNKLQKIENLIESLVMRSLAGEEVDPIHPGEVLTQLIKSRGMTIKEFAHTISMGDVKMLENICNCIEPMTMIVAPNLVESFSLPVQYWMHLQEKYDEATVEVNDG